MPLPVDYDTPEGEELAELAIREALVGCFLTVAGNATFGFDANVVHQRLRYPSDNKTWEVIATIVDPDTADQDESQQTRLLRYFAVSLVGFNGSARELKLRYAVKTSFGFKDVYKDDVTKNSSDQLTGCMMRYQKYLRDNLNLGLDDRVSHEYLQLSAVRFVLKDKQGNAVQVADSSIVVTLEVC